MQTAFAPEIKVPVRVMTVPPVVSPTPGELTAGPTLKYWKFTDDTDCAYPFRETRRATVPDTPGGDVQLTDVPAPLTTPALVDAPKWQTALVPVRKLPLTTTGVPPATFPLDGDTDVTVGAANTSTGSEFEFSTSLNVNWTFTVWGDVEGRVQVIVRGGTPDTTPATSAGLELKRQNTGAMLTSTDDFRVMAAAVDSWIRTGVTVSRAALMFRYRNDRLPCVCCPLKDTDTTTTPSDAAEGTLQVRLDTESTVAGDDTPPNRHTGEADRKSVV